MNAFDLEAHKTILESKWKNLDDVKSSTDQEARYVMTLFPMFMQQNVHRAIESIRGSFAPPPPSINIALADEANKWANKQAISQPVLESGQNWDSADDSSDVDTIDLSDYEDETKNDKDEDKKILTIEQGFGTLRVQKTHRRQLTQGTLIGQDNPIPDKTGYLEKKRPGLIGVWQLRYFVLLDHTLFWFKAKQDADPRGFLKLTDADVSSVTEENGIIKIVGGHKTYKLRHHDALDNSGEVASWTKVLVAVRARYERARQERLRCKVASKALGLPTSPHDSSPYDTSFSPNLTRLRAATAFKVLAPDKLAGTLAMFDPLLKGQVMAKFKYKRRQRRLLFLTPRLDLLCWSAAFSRDNLKGSLEVSQMMSVKKGCPGCKTDTEFGFSIVTLDIGNVSIEADSEEQRSCWLSCLQELIRLAQAGFIPLKSEAE